MKHGPDEWRGDGLSNFCLLGLKTHLNAVHLSALYVHINIFPTGRLHRRFRSLHTRVFFAQLLIEITTHHSVFSTLPSWYTLFVPQNFAFALFLISLSNPKRNFKTNLTQNFGGQTGCLIGDSKIAHWRWMIVIFRSVQRRQRKFSTFHGHWYAIIGHDL